MKNGSCTDSAKTRSAAAFPADYRRVLEASNLPVEVATAIADRLDKCGGPDDEWNTALEAAAKACEWEERANPSAMRHYRTCASEIRKLKRPTATPESPK